MLAAALIVMPMAAATLAQQGSSVRPPAFQVDEKWPTIPNNWVLGEVSSIAVDPQDRIWVLHRPRDVHISPEV